MAGYRLAPLAARARRRPWQRRNRRVFAVAVVPAQISGSSSAAATGSLSLTAPPVLGSLASTATADGTLTLATSSAVGVRAAPGWLGLFITDTGGSPIPTIDGSSNAVATGALSLITPARALISGSSSATSSGTLLLRAIGSGVARIVRPTRHGSPQFGATRTSSAQTGATRTVEVNEVTIP